MVDDRLQRIGNKEMTPYFKIFLYIIMIPLALLMVHCSANAQKQKDIYEQQARQLMEDFNRKLQEQPQRSSNTLVPVQHVQSDTIESKRELTTFKLTVVLLAQEAVKEKCAKLGVWGGQVPNVRFAVGCTHVNLTTNEATIYASRPLTLNDQRTLVLGHELWHVIAGRYHEE